MITLERFRLLEAAVRAAGYDDAIAWSETAGPPTSPEDFASHAIYVIINGGMTNAVTVAIYDRCITALNASGSCKAVYGHPGKSSGIDDIWARRVEFYEGYLTTNDKVRFADRCPGSGRSHASTSPRISACAWLSRTCICAGWRKLRAVRRRSCAIASRSRPDIALGPST